MPSSILTFFAIAAIFSLTHVSHAQFGSPDNVIELCRHGARGPGDNTFDKTWPSWGLSNLTPAGMRQHFILGAALAKKYPNIFGSLNPNAVNLMSEGGNRTTMSALAQAYGLFYGKGPALGNDYPSARAVPPFDMDIINDIGSKLNNSAALPFNYYPINIQIAKGGDYKVIEPRSGCDNFKYYEALSIFSPEAFETWENFTDLSRYLKRYNLTIPMNNPLAITGFSDTFAANYFDHRPLPGGLPTTDDVVANITFVASWYGTYLQYGTDVKTNAVATPIVLRLIEVLQAAAQGKLSPFTLYAGHDIGLLALLKAFGVVTPDCIIDNFIHYWAWGNKTLKNPACVYPSFASNILIEFYKNPTPSVRFLYNDIMVPLCAGKEFCPLNEFIQFAQNAIGNWTMKDVNRTCGISPSSFEVDGEIEIALINSSFNCIRP